MRLTPTIPTLLAQASSSPRAVLLPILFLVALVAAAGIAIVFVRRSLLTKADSDAGWVPLEELRKARDRGELTREEFETAKNVLRSKLDSPTGPIPAPPARRSSVSRDAAPTDPSVRAAAPGFDLTGARLPNPHPPRERDQ